MLDWPNHVRWQNIPQLKLENILDDSPNIQHSARCEKDFKNNKHKASIWGENMLGYNLSLDIVCSSKRSRKTVSFEEQITSKDKYPGILSPQMGASAVGYVYVIMMRINWN